MTFCAVSFLWKSHDADKPHVSQIAKHTALLQLTRVVDCLVVARVQFHYSYKNFFPNPPTTNIVVLVFVCLVSYGTGSLSVKIKTSDRRSLP